MQLLESPNARVVAATIPTAVVLALGWNGSAAAALTVLGVGLSLVACRAVGASGSTPGALWPAVGVLTVLAVLRAPIGSHDLWSYAFYGRMVSQYGADPYTAVPASFPHDLVFPVVGWHHTSSGYGPLFTLWSAAWTSAAGESLLAMRLGFQLVAAGSVLWCLRVLDRAGHAATLTLVALAPFVWVSVVNGGHNDAVVAAVLLGVVLAFRKDRIITASVLVGLAALVKLSAVFLVVPLVFILAARRRWRSAAIMAAGPVLAVLVGAMVAPNSLTNPSAATREKISRTSVWHPVKVLTDLPAHTITLLATLAVASAIVWIAWTRRRDHDPSLSAGASLSMFGMGASYTLPWYLVWGLPMLALSGDVVITAIVAVRASLMMASYELGSGSMVREAVVVLLSTVVPWVLLAAFLRVSLHRRTPGAADTVDLRGGADSGSGGPSTRQPSPTPKR